MKNPLLLLLLVISVYTTSGQTTKDNSELTESQSSPKPTQCDQDSLTNQEERKGRIGFLNVETRKTSKDYYHSAMIFQQGLDTFATSMAVKIMKRSLELDSSINKLLLAAAIDRDLMRRGEPQIFGTQYTSVKGGFFQRYELDSTKISDEVRREYNVETLAEQQEKLKALNRKPLSELVDAGMSVTKVIDLVNNMDQRNPEYDISESGINKWGYSLLGKNNGQEAVAIFKLNTELYPGSANTYNSYGEALLKIGQTKAAIAAYKKALELNPDNTNAKKVLLKLE